MSQRPFIHFHRPSLDEAEITAVVEALRSGWLTTGPRTSEFEARFGKYTGGTYALAVNSCTAALQVALTALGIGPGQEVITTPLTFCSTVNTILHAGATPVLADIGPDGNIDPECVAAKINERTAALLPVHFAGHPCNMEALWDLARQFNLSVIEDAAHAVGSHYKGYPIGAGYPPRQYKSDAVAFSFYATKNMTTGEGGMVTTHSEVLAERMRMLCLHGIDKSAWNRYAEAGRWSYEVIENGFKCNLSDIQSAIGIHQLRKLDGFIDTRTHYANLYRQALADVEEIETPVPPVEHRHSWHLYVIRLNLATLTIDRAQFIEELRNEGVGTSVHFIPIPLHPAFATLAALPQNACPRAIELFPRLISLPLYPGMTEEMICRVTDSVKRIAARYRKRATKGALRMSAALDI
jgi:dTDP-4-amino-4,6-dideoxygalactose transaminase